MKLPLFQVDAFASQPFQGNPAAVCPLETWLPEELMQSIAGENNLAETAFVVPEESGYALRWFTPTTEVDLCGHATLAAAHVLFQTECREKTQITFQSKSGPLHVLREGELLTLDFPAKPGSPCTPPAVLIEALGETPSECLRAMDYLVVYGSEATIRRLSPDFVGLKALDMRGVIVSAPGETSDFVSRFFAPGRGIDEDPVTGSAHCTLTPYWADRLSLSRLHARQLSKRTGELWCRLEGDRVLISGRTIGYLEGVIQLDARSIP